MTTKRLNEIIESQRIEIASLWALVKRLEAELLKQGKRTPLRKRSPK